MRISDWSSDVCSSDLRLRAAADEVATVAPGGRDDVLPVPTDVARVEEVRRLRERVLAAFGEIDVLMNHGGVQPGSGVFGPAAAWERILGVNLWGVVHGTQGRSEAHTSELQYIKSI